MPVIPHNAIPTNTHTKLLNPLGKYFLEGIKITIGFEYS